MAKDISNKTAVTLGGAPVTLYGSFPRRRANRPGVHAGG